MNTQWGPRFRLQVTLLDGEAVNVRIHACKDCDFIEWSDVKGDKVADTELSDEFIAKLQLAITHGENRCLAELVPEGVKALGEYSEANTKLFTT